MKKSFGSLCVCVSKKEFFESERWIFYRKKKSCCFITEIERFFELFSLFLAHLKFGVNGLGRFIEQIFTEILKIITN